MLCPSLGLGLVSEAAWGAHAWRSSQVVRREPWQQAEGRGKALPAFATLVQLYGMFFSCLFLSHCCKTCRPKTGFIFICVPQKLNTVLHFLLPMGKASIKTHYVITKNTPIRMSDISWNQSHPTKNRSKHLANNTKYPTKPSLFALKPRP